MRKFVIAWLALLIAAPAMAQSFEAGANLTIARWSEFDGNDVGVGARFTFKPLPLIGIDADLTWYPGDFPPDTVTAFSGQRIEGMFGATVGPTFGRVRPFVKAGGGFVDIGATPRVFACITIFPPPLACTLAGGQTLPAYEVGGGVEIGTSAHTFMRADASDRILKYPGPTFDSDFQIHNEGFFGGALRFTLGGGMRF